MTGGSFWRMREEASSSALLIGLGFLLLVAAISTYLSWETSYRSSLARQANEIRLASLELLNAVQSEEIFSTLMGEDVEARRKFIEENALDVKNLDV